MRLLVPIIIALLLVNSCAHPIHIKNGPEYTGVDPRVKKFVIQYKRLAHKHKISFTKDVTIGFKKINEEYVIGTCTYSQKFREIDLDTDYWNSASDANKASLIFHELSHCYCNRDHDFDTGTKYPEDEENIALDRVKSFISGDPRPGFYDGLCPKSIMYPIIIKDLCMYVYHDEYVNEMFQRCVPY